MLACHRHPARARSKRPVEGRLGKTASETWLTMRRVAVCDRERETHLVFKFSKNPRTGEPYMVNRKRRCIVLICHGNDMIRCTQSCPPVVSNSRKRTLITGINRSLGFQ